MDTNNLSSSANNSSSQTGVAHLTSEPIYTFTKSELLALFEAIAQEGKKQFVAYMKKEGML